MTDMNLEATDEDMDVFYAAYQEDAANPGAGLVPDFFDNVRAGVNAVLARYDLARRSPAPAPVTGVRALTEEEAAALLGKINGGRQIIQRESDAAVFVSREVAIEAIQSALLPSSGPEGVEGKWQPIETAPKDGTKVDVWVRPHDANGNPARITGVWFRDGKWKRRLAGWEHDVDARGVPTHWMRVLAPSSSPTATMEPT